MSTGRLEVICGEDSSGKTAMALGRALQALTEQKTVIVIQFLKGSEKTWKSGSAKANGAGTQSIPV